MNSDCLKLSCYYGERHRTEHGFVADHLLNLYGRHDTAVSITLRGVEGFGLKHHLRTDTSLTLSEDLPAVTIAVDTRPRIQALVGEVAALPGIGLITLERARMLQDRVGALTLPADLQEATRLTVFLGRKDRVDGSPGFVAVCDLLHRRGIAGATVLLGVDGTAHGHRERAQFFGRNANVPLMVLAVGAGPQITAVLPELGTLLNRPLITLERVRICKRDGTLMNPPQQLPRTDDQGLALWQKLSIYTSEGALHHGQPIHRAITRALRAHGSTGATSLRGIWGFHGDHPPHGDRPFQIGRRVPTVTVVIDTPDKISQAFKIIDTLTHDRGLVTSELVPAVRSAAAGRGRGGLDLANHTW
jgi:PII-like signaling protein